MPNESEKDQYKVEGYNHRTEYDGPYHPSADFDPAFVFAHSGSTEKQEQYQKDLVELDKGEGRNLKEALIQGVTYSQGDEVIVREDFAGRKTAKSKTGPKNNLRDGKSAHGYLLSNEPNPDFPGDPEDEPRVAHKQSTGPKGSPEVKKAPAKKTTTKKATSKKTTPAKKATAKKSTTRKVS